MHLTNDGCKIHCESSSESKKNRMNRHDGSTTRCGGEQKPRPARLKGSAGCHVRNLDCIAFSLALARK